MILVVSVVAFAQEDLINEDLPAINEESLAIPNQQANLDNNLGIPADSEESLRYNSCFQGCSLCETRCKDSALQNYAERSMDLSLCSKLSAEFSKTMCNDNVNSALAISSKDQTKCDLIMDENLKSSCLLVVSQQKAVDSGNTDSCSSFPEFQRENCINQVNFALAIKNNDVSLCNKLQTPQKEDCIFNVNEAQNGAVQLPIQQEGQVTNPELISDISNNLGNLDNNLGIPADSEESLGYNSCLQDCSLCETRCKDSALQNYAERSMDLSLCSKLSVEFSKTMCNDNVNSALAISSKDQTKCDLIMDENLKSSCLLVVSQQKAVDSGNTDSCSSLPEFQRENCINQVNFALAIKNNDVSLCNKLQTPQKDDCILRVKGAAGIQTNQPVVQTNVAPQKTSLFKIFALENANWPLIGGIAAGVVVILLLTVGIIFFIRREPKINEAPLIFQQQKQPSQLAKMVPLNKAQPSQQDLDLKKIQDAFKKVGP